MVPWYWLLWPFALVALVFVVGSIWVRVTETEGEREVAEQWARLRKIERERIKRAKR